MPSVFTLSKLAAVTLLAASATVSSAASATAPSLVTGSGSPTTSMIRQCGQQMWAVGSFASVKAAGQPAVTRNNIFAFDLASGVIAAVNPDVNGPVRTIAFSPDCSSAYIGGAFTSVGGVASSNIAKIATASGVVDPLFARNASKQVRALAYAGTHLLVGGDFTTINGSTGTASAYLTSLSPSTGIPDGYANNMAITGTLPNDHTGIRKMWVNPAGSRVAIDGVFTSALGQPRRQAFVVDLAASSLSLDPWFSTTLNQSCTPPSEQFYAQSMAWSPDGAYLYIASTGFAGATLCDSVAKFSAAPKAGQLPIWVNKTGGDSLYSVVATLTDVYIGGHERWANNPLGQNSCGTGCVPRPGIGDISATTGLATSWNPTRSRGHGAQDLFLDSLGDLWVSSDAPLGSLCAGAPHPGICEFPHA